MSSNEIAETPENGNDHSVNRTRKFAEWLIAREQAKQAEEPIDKQMKMLRINTFLTLAILLAVGSAEYNTELLSILWFL